MTKVQKLKLPEMSSVTNRKIKKFKKTKNIKISSTSGGCGFGAMLRGWGLG